MKVIIQNNQITDQNGHERSWECHKEVEMQDLLSYYWIFLSKLSRISMYQLSSVNQSNQNQDSVEPIGDIQKEVPFVDYLDQVAFGWLTELIELTYAMLRSGAFMSLRRWHPLNDTMISWAIFTGMNAYLQISWAVMCQNEPWLLKAWTQPHL